MCAYFGRGVNKLDVDYRTIDVFKHYIKLTGNPRGLTQRKFTKVFKELSDKIHDEIIFKNYEFIYPNRLGSLRIKRYKRRVRIDENGELYTKNLPVDWEATLKLWSDKPEHREKKTLIYNFNNHSDGYNVVYVWSRSKCAACNCSQYAFKPTREHKRLLAKAMKENKILYYE